MANVGSIEYIASIDFTQMIADQRRIEAGLNQTASHVNGLSRATENATSAFGRLRTMAIAVAGALSIREVLAYADAWTTVNNKLSNSVLAHETQSDVMGRVFEISQRTATSLDATATLYQRLAASAQQLNMTGTQLGAVTETINKAFAVSGATGAEASGAIVQLGQALGAGALRGEEFNSVNEAAPRIMKAIADEMGVARGELKSYAAAGLITSDIVIAAMANQADAIDSEFGKMNRTLAQNTQIAKNNAMQWIGSSGMIQNATSAIGAAFVTVSEHLDELFLVGSMVASVMFGKLTQAAYGYVAAQIQQIQATVAANRAEATRLAALEQEAIAIANAARANVVLAESEVTAAAAALRDAQAQQALATTEMAQSEAALAASMATQRLSAAESQLAVASEQASIATRNQAAATSAAGTAASAASGSMTLLRGAMALLGGPAGVVMIAASAMLYFAGKSDDAAASVSRLTTELEQATRNVKELNKAQAQGQLAEWKNKLDEANTAAQGFAEKAEKAAKAVEQLKKYKAGELSLGELNRSLDFTDMTIFYKSAADVEAQLVKYQREKEVALGQEATARQQIVNIMKLQGQLQEQITNPAKQQKSAAGPSIPDDLRKQGDKMRQALMTNRQKIEAEYAADVKALKDRSAALEAARKTATGKALGNINAQQAEIDAQIQLAGQLRDKRLSEEGAREDKAAAAQDKRNKRHQAMTQKHYDKLTALEIKREAQQLAYQAKIEETHKKHIARLNEILLGANTAELVLEAQKRINQERLDEFDAQFANEEMRNQAWVIGSAEYWNARAIIEQEGQEKLDAINKEAQARRDRADALAQGIFSRTQTPEQKKAGVDQQVSDAMAKLNTEYAARELDIQLMAEYEAKKTAIAQAGSDARKQIELDYVETQAQMWGHTASSMEAFANGVGAMFGKQTAAYKAAFIVQKGFAIASGTLNLYSAALAAMNAPSSLEPAQKFANYAAVFAAGGNLMSTISSISYGGGKQYGGPVAGNTMYRMGEQGPEIFRGTSGKNYVIPGENGRVIPNNGIGGGVTINIINNAGADVSASSSNDGRQIDIIVDRAAREVGRQFANNTGPAAAGLKAGYNVSSKL